MARLKPEDMEPVREMLNSIKDVQQCIEQVRYAAGDCDSFKVRVFDGQCMADVLIASTPQSAVVVLRGLEAMERELRSQLQALQIEVAA
jgi:hypothetical protein